jgi:hypothetical protein
LRGGSDENVVRAFFEKKGGFHFPGRFEPTFDVGNELGAGALGLELLCDEAEAPDRI